ncbi:hypothetical protein KA005_38025 [bacterium]|nr:hypothetical protein [bacterium]
MAQIPVFMTWGSRIGWKYETKDKKRICVKAIDVFGVDTTTVIHIEV